MKNHMSSFSENKKNRLGKEFSPEDLNFASGLSELSEKIAADRAFVSRLEARLVAAVQSKDGKFSQKKEGKMKSRHAVSTGSWTYPLIGFVVLSLLAIALLAVPDLQYTLRNILGSFIQSTPVQPSFTSTPVPTLNPVLVPTTAQEVKATQPVKNPTPVPQVEYQIKLPTKLPEGWKVQSSQIGTNGGAWIIYVINRGASFLELTIQPAEYVQDALLGPEGKVESVQIGNLSAEYVRGTWFTGNAIMSLPNPQESENLGWADQIGINKLSWVDEGLRYLLVTDAETMGKHDLLVIASSMQPKSPTTGTWPIAQSFTPAMDEPAPVRMTDVNLVKSHISFPLLEPTFLPGSYQFSWIDPTLSYVGVIGSRVELVYTCQQDPNWSIRLAEWKRMEGDPTPYFPANEIGENAILDQVSINDAMGLSMNDNNHYRLRWYQDGFGYEISTNLQGPCTLSKDDLIKMAESLK